MVGVYTTLVVALIGLAVWLARLSGKQSAHIESLKKEAEKYAESQQIMGRVHAMPVDVVRRRLQEYTK